MKNKQLKEWEGEFGSEYTKRNLYTLPEFDELHMSKHGITRSEAVEPFLGRLSRDMKILEIGTNVGLELKLLANMGFKHLYGIEINDDAIDISKKITQGLPIYIVKGSAFDIPYKDEYFDLVFTAGVLIHISPRYIKDALKEIYRVAKKYIWGNEYYAEEYEEVLYRGKKDLLWKTNFSKLYIDSFDDLKLVKEKRMKYFDTEKITGIFLLKKMNKQ